MAKNITPGTLCLTINAGDLSGYVVTAETPVKAGSSFFLNTLEKRAIVGLVTEDCWMCLFQRPVNIPPPPNHVLRFPMSERCLLPLSDPDAELTTDKAEEKHV